MENIEDKPEGAKQNPKQNWARHGRLLQAMHEKRINAAGLLRLMDNRVSKQYLHRVLWGYTTPRQTEDQIALILGRRWEDLFDDTHGPTDAHA